MAFQKHIEIERPSPVSPQHVIALQLDMCVGTPTDLTCVSMLTNPLAPVCRPRTQQLRTELPIHLRYQAPSTTELYRPAVIMAPEAFVFCASISTAPASGTGHQTPASGTASQHFEVRTVLVQPED